MKKAEICIILLLNMLISLAQPPESFKYQAVARDNAGNPLANKNMAFRISILNGSPAAGAVYIEDHQKMTNGFGLVELEIGKGNVRAGTFPNIDWGKDAFFIKVEMDPLGGVAFQHLGTSQLLSVPYALYAKDVQNKNDADADPTNELQTLSLSGNELSLSKGGGNVILPAGSSLWTENSPDIYRNIGKVGIGTATPAALLHVEGKGTGQGNVVFVGDFNTDPGNPPVSGNGTRMMWYPDKAAFRAGFVKDLEWDKQNIGLGSTAMGVGPIASGDFSVALGAFSVASGENSTAMGPSTTALKFASTALGVATKASGDYSTAIGWGATAYGIGSTAMGYATSASARLSTAIGSYNVGGGNETTWIATDPLFEIGNGSFELPHNAMTVLKNGYVGFGTATPAAGLHIKGKDWPESFIYLESESGGDAGIRFYEGSKLKWQIYNELHSGNDNLHFVNGAGQSCLFISQGSTNVGIGVNSPSYKLEVSGPVNLNSGISWGAALHCNGAQAIWYDGTYFSWGYGGTYNYFADKVTIGNAANPGNFMLYVQGNAFSTGTWNSSDIRFKKNIKTIENSLEKVMKTRGVTFEYRMEEFRDYRFAEGRRAGFIAQEIEEIFPEVVSVDANGYKSINYSEFIPLLLEALKEQQNTISRISADRDILKTRCESIEKDNALISDRLSKLEMILGLKVEK
jgi:hypothetical protein